MSNIEQNAKRTQGEIIQQAIALGLNPYNIQANHGRANRGRTYAYTQKKAVGRKFKNGPVIFRFIKHYKQA